MSESKNKKVLKVKCISVRHTPGAHSYVLRRFEEMEEFKFFSLSAIAKEKRSFSRRMDNAIAGMSEEVTADYFAHNADDFFLIHDVFQQTSLRSFLVILYSYVESGMNLLCNAEYADRRWAMKAQGLSEFNVTVKDMQGDGIMRSKLYLEKIIGRHLHCDCEPWSEINTLRKIRNGIVHASATASEDLRRDSNFKRHVVNGKLGLVNEKTIVINPPYLDSILDNVRMFFNAIDMR